jgi:hypothetical protein
MNMGDPGGDVGSVGVYIGVYGVYWTPSLECWSDLVMTLLQIWTSSDHQATRRAYGHPRGLADTHCRLWSKGEKQCLCVYTKSPAERDMRGFSLAFIIHEQQEGQHPSPPP